MTNLLQLMRRFRKDEGGSSTVEFIIVAATFLTGFFWVFESGLILTKKVMLERALDMTVRELRLHSSPLFTHDYIKTRICQEALLLDDCENNLLLELEVLDLSAGFSSSFSCVDKENDITPVTTWQPGQRNEIVYMRACVVVFPILTGAMSLFKDGATKGVPLVADTAFVNEPG
jgi:hypothetical protein